MTTTPTPASQLSPAPETEWSFDGGKTWTTDPAVPTDMFGSVNIMARSVQRPGTTVIECPAWPPSPARSDLTGQDIEAADRQAALYEGDDREYIKTDVINSFYAGVAYERKRVAPARSDMVEAEMDAAWQKYRNGKVRPLSDAVLFCAGYRAASTTPAGGAEECVPVAYLYEWIGGEDRGTRKKGDLIARTVAELGGNIDLYPDKWRRVCGLVEEPAGHAPSGEEIATWQDRVNARGSRIDIMAAMKEEIADLRAALARRATAGTTAAPSGEMSKAEIDDIVYQCRQSGNDTTYDIVNAALKRRATAGNAAPTEGNNP